MTGSSDDGAVSAPSPSTEAYDHPDEAHLAAFRRVYDIYARVTPSRHRGRVILRRGMASA